MAGYRKPAGPALGPRGKSDKKADKKARRDIPHALGVALSAALLCVALVVGNARALARAGENAQALWPQVAACAQERAGDALNLAQIAARYDALSEAEVQALRDAAQALGEAQGAQETAAASDALQTLVSDASVRLMAAGLSEADERALSSVMDDFTESGNMLRQRARQYNGAAQRALDVYARLPARLVLPAPQAYPGL